jgi:CDP-diacylglycerol--serine O-phosphatidyltransferase
MKQIPNLFTLLNLVFGCIAIAFILQTGEAIVVLDNTGAVTINLPEKIWLGALFIFAAAAVDFLDGFLARLMNVPSEMGKQLDSLSDVVSFGVAPGMILFQLLRLSYAQEDNGLDISFLALVPAFIFPVAAAWRLAKFNISTDQSDSFRGVPSPAAGLVIASLPLILQYNAPFRELVLNKWFLNGVILAISWLMISNVRLMALKFKDYSFRNNTMKYVLLIISIGLIVFFKWAAVPLIFVAYLVCSLFAGKTASQGNLQSPM